MFCPKCGEKLPDDAAFCHRCGESLINLRENYPSEQAHQSSQAPAGLGSQKEHPAANPYVHSERERDRYQIPVEYPPYFNRHGWCWPGFWFPALWCCYKGIYNQAWKYILIGLIPYIGGIIAGIWCGKVGYREYSDFINNNDPEQIRQAKSTGMGCFWVLLLLPLGCYILYTLLLLGAMSLSATNW